MKNVRTEKLGVLNDASKASDFAFTVNVQRVYPTSTNHCFLGYLRGSWLLIFNGVNSNHVL